MTQPPLRILYTGCALAGCTTSLKSLYPRLEPSSEYQLEPLLGGAPSPVRNWVWPGRSLAVQVRHDYRSNLWIPRLHDANAPPEFTPYFRETQRFLSTVDRILFVVDSQLERLEANLERLEALSLDLTDAGRNVHEIPVVFQLNKRDLPNVVPSEELVQKLKTRRCSYVETIASKGMRVAEAFAQCCAD